MFEEPQEMKPYQPSLAVPAGGLVMLLLAALLGGAVIGGLVSILSTNLIYVIVLFPIGMGLLGGWVIAAAVRAGKVRHPGMALAAAVLMGLVMYAAMWTTDFIQYRASTTASAQDLNPADADSYINSELVKKTGQPGFVGFVLLRDQEGERFGHLPDGSYWLNLGPTFSWIYWALELALIIWMSILVGRKPAYVPFCETCQRWLDQPKLVGTLGASRSKELLGYVESGNYLKLGEELQSNPALPNLGVFVADCGADCTDGDAFLAVRRQARNSNGNVTAKDVQSGLISSAQLQELRRGIENRKALYGN
jgi:hypothetical protein